MNKRLRIPPAHHAGGRVGFHLPAILLAAMAWTATSSALAYHPLITDDTGTQGMGGNQFELGFDLARSEAAGTTSIERAVPLTFTRGLGDGLDVFASVARQTTPGDGWGNVNLGAKWRFYENPTERFSLALKPDIRLPLSRAKEAAGFGNGKTSYGLNLILTRETGFGELHFNLAAERNRYADTVTFTDRKTLYRASIAPVWNVADGWKLAAELGLQTNPDRGEKSRMGFLGLGVVYSASEDLDFSAGVTRDWLDGPVSSTAATFGLTWRFH